MQSSVNKVILLGIIGKKIEFRRLERGGALCRFTVGTLDYFTDKVTGQKKTTTDWHSVSSWGDQAKEITKQLTKGCYIYIEAKLKMRSWQSKEGVTHKGYELFLETYQLLSSSLSNEQKPVIYSMEGIPNTPTPLPGFETNELDELPF